MFNPFDLETKQNPFEEDTVVDVEFEELDEDLKEQAKALENIIIQD